MQDLTFNRREFLKLSGGSAALSLATATGYIGLLPVPAQAAAAGITLQVLDQQQARLVLTIARTLFPHDFLADSQYMPIVASVDANAAEDADTAQMVQDALAGFGADFNILSEADREAKLREIEDSPFFKLVYNEALMGLYNNSELWPVFGYEGSSVEHGGYIERGFDDLDWLPSA